MEAFGVILVAIVFVVIAVAAGGDKKLLYGGGLRAKTPDEKSADTAMVGCAVVFLILVIISTIVGAIASY